MASQKVAPSKAAPKPDSKAAKPTKGSRFEAIKSALFGGGKKAPSPAPVAAKGKAPAHPPLPASKKGAPAPVAGKKGAPAAAATANGKAPAPTTRPPRARKGAAKEIVPRERMAGPSIRVSYDANGEAVCREVACEGLATSAGYCRLHYIKNWKKIQRKSVIIKEGKLNQYIEELVAKYPDKYIEAIRQDLANDKDFAKVIYDLDLDESVDDFEVEGESLDAIVGDIKRDFDDEGEGGF